MAVTLRGKQIDMARLVSEHGSKRALGNANMNARGDLLAADGHVLRSHEAMTAAYHRENPKAVRQVGINSIEKEMFPTPAEAVATQRKLVADQKAALAEQQKLQAQKRKTTDSPDESN
jgi:hypothetical protein